MSKDFAEKVLDTIYAKFTERKGIDVTISGKQFNIVTEYLEHSNPLPNGFVAHYYGNLGKYYISIQDEHNTSANCFTVDEIRLRDEAEVDAEREAEAAAKAKEDAIKAGFAAGVYVGEPKKRFDFTLTLASDHEFEGYYGLTHVYEFADEDGNCIVWMTGNPIECYDEESDQWVYAEVGDKIEMKATVKEHKEYKGIKQTMVNRPKINRIYEA